MRRGVKPDPLAMSMVILIGRGMSPRSPSTCAHILGVGGVAFLFFCCGCHCWYSVFCKYLFAVDVRCRGHSRLMWGIAQVGGAASPPLPCIHGRGLG